MNRALVLLVALETAVIILLVILHLSSEPPVHEERDSVTVREQAAPGSVPVRSARPGGPGPASSDHEAPPSSAPAPEYAIVHGEVSDSTGQPVIGGWVRFRDKRGRSTQVPIQQGGHYAMAGLEPGPGMIHATAHEKGAEKEEPITLAVGVTRHDIVIPKTLKIRVRFETPDGEDLVAALRQEGVFTGGLTAVATTRPPGDRLQMTSLSGHFRYGTGEFRGMLNTFGSRKRLPAGVAGVLIVRGPLPVHVSAVFMHLVLETREVTEPVEELRFVLTPERVSACLATVRLRVVDAETNEPLKASVTICDQQSRTLAVSLDGDEEGWLIRPNVPPGLKMLEIERPDYQSIHTYIRVLRGGPLELGTFHLHKAVTIRGRVVGPAGEPVSCMFEARDADRMTFPQPLIFGSVTRTDPEGRFEVPSVGRGRYLLLAWPQEWARAVVVVDTSSGPVDNVEIRLQKGPSVILEPQFDGTQHYRVSIRDKRGVLHYTCAVRGPWSRRVILATGTYTIEISDDQGVRRTESLEVGTEPLTLPVNP